MTQGFWMGGMEESAYAYWKVAIPVVVFGAPCGAWLASYCHRLVLAWFVQARAALSFLLENPILVHMENPYRDNKRQCKGRHHAPLV